MIASLNTVRVCACVHITMRIGMHDLFCERPFETRLFPWAKSIINSGSREMTKKIKVAVEGIKLATGFWRYRPKRLLFELPSRKSRTLGVDQNFLIFWRPRYILTNSINVKHHIRSDACVCVSLPQQSLHLSSANIWKVWLVTLKDANKGSTWLYQDGLSGCRVVLCQNYLPAADLIPKTWGLELNKAVYTLHCHKNDDTLKQCPTNWRCRSGTKAKSAIIRHAAHASQMSTPKHPFLSRFKPIFYRRNLEVKLPTIWTDEKQRWEESEKRKEERR